MVYMQYVCKNPSCDAIFIAQDLYGRATPERWRYCPVCEAKGFPVIKNDPDFGSTTKAITGINNLTKTNSFPYKQG